MLYEVIIHPDFKEEILQFDYQLQVSFKAYIELLKIHGHELKRPYSDTLKSSKFKNLKELRITTLTGEWRISYAFDPERKAVILMGASKSGMSQRLFYNKLIALSEKRYESHLERLNSHA